MSNSRVLLDKNVAREILEGLERNAQGIALDARQRTALETLRNELLAGKQLYIVPATENYLSRHFGAREEVRFLRDRVEVIVPARYYKRWARRLKDFGFTREDAHVLALGTFGTDEEGNFLGTHEFLTFDKPLVTLFDIAGDKIQKKLDAMTINLEAPYDEAKLPDVKLLDRE